MPESKGGFIAFEFDLAGLLPELLKKLPHTFYFPSLSEFLDEAALVRGDGSLFANCVSHEYFWCAYPTPGEQSGFRELKERCNAIEREANKNISFEIVDGLAVLTAPIPWLMRLGRLSVDVGFFRRTEWRMGLNHCMFRFRIGPVSIASLVDREADEPVLLRDPRFDGFYQLRSCAGSFDEMGGSILEMVTERLFDPTNTNEYWTELDPPSMESSGAGILVFRALDD